MSGLEITVDASHLARLANQLSAIGHATPLAIRRALNHTGDKARTAMVRSLTTQTGLKRKVIVKALKVKRPTSGNPAKGQMGGSQSYTIESRGGDISLKFFGARETRRGVSAAPWGRRTIYSGTFIRGGLFPNRSGLVGGGHVFRRVGKGRKPLAMEKSHLFIPIEMVSGATAAAFRDVVARDLPGRLSHEVGILMATGGF